MYIDVNNYKNLSCDSDMIQSALEDAKESGYAVIIPKINKRTGKDIWEISKTVYLYSESTLIIHNAHIRMADDSICYMFSNINSLCTNGETNSDITIKGIGKAILDGGNHNGLYEVNGIVRTASKYPEHQASDNCMFLFQNVKNLLIDNITIKDSRYWAICLKSTTYSRISNIHFESSSNVPNQDGVDLLKGCHDVIIENITGCVGDNIVALLATNDDIYGKITEDLSRGDIYNITIRNLMIYGVGGCALVRLLNHDGFKIYNVRIDNLIETSQWSETDASVAQNPDLVIKCDENGNPIPWKKLIPGEKGYRTEAAILIGESYWYSDSKAQHGDTFGISVSNVTTHSRFAVWINNTLLDSTFENIRMFGNGYMATYFGEGTMENIRFSNISYDKNCKPVKGDESIYIEWNNTKAEGLSSIYLNGSNVSNIEFDNVKCCENVDSVFGGNGCGEITLKNLKKPDSLPLTNAKGINIISK